MKRMLLAAVACFFVHQVAAFPVLAPISLSSIGAAGPVFNVLKYGADPTGGTDSTAAFNAAYLAAAGSGGRVWIPAGHYLIIEQMLGSVVIAGNTDTFGDGIGKTVISCNNSSLTGTAPPCFYLSTAATYVTMHDFSIVGSGLTDQTLFGENLSIQNTINVALYNIESKYSNGLAFDLKEDSNVWLHDNLIEYPVAGGATCWSSPNCTFNHNVVTGSNDDGFAAHSQDSDPSPVRAVVNATDNLFVESEGIKILGPKMFNITGNIFVRPMDHAIYLDSQSSFAQGDTAGFAVNVSHNIMADFIKRPETPPKSNGNSYIFVSGGPKGASLLPTFGASNTVGAMWQNATNGSTTTPGGGYFHIDDNIMLRTVPPVTAYAQWGFDAQLWVGLNGSTPPYFAGAIAEANLEPTGITFLRPIRNATVRNNIISTSGTPILFTETDNVTNNLDYDDIDIEDNTFSDFCVAGIFASGNATLATYQSIRVVNNMFDADPRNVCANRGANGTWAANSAPFGINAPLMNGFVFDRNRFRNLVAPLQMGSAIYEESGNVWYGNPTALGFSTSNVGIATVPPSDSRMSFIAEDDNPNSSTYKSMLQRTVTSATSVPTTGIWITGTFVTDSAPSTSGSSTLIGWMRLSTGSSNVVPTDWQPVYAPSDTIANLLQSPPVTIGGTTPANINGLAGTFTGLVSGNSAATSAYLKANRAAGSQAGVEVDTAGATRFRIIVNGSAEMGGGTGSNLVIQCFDDTGAIATTCGTINRASGNWTIPNALTVQTGLTFSGTIPTVSEATGTPTIKTGSTNNAGFVTEGAGSTNVVITWSSGQIWTAGGPYCDVTSYSGVVPTSIVANTSSLTINHVSATGDAWKWGCN